MRLWIPPGRTAARAGVFAAVAAVALAVALWDGSYGAVPRQRLFLLVWWTLAIGAAFGLLPRRRLPRWGGLAVVALLAVAGWAGVTLLWTESAERSVVEVTRALGYAGVLLLTLCVVSRSLWRVAAAGLTIGAVAVCVAALVGRLVPGAGPDAVLWAFSGARLSSPLGYWNATAVWGAMATTLVLTWSAHARTPAVRAAAMAAVPVCVLVAYLTYSRAGLAATIVGVVLVVVLGAHRWTAAVHTAVGAAGSGLVIFVVHHAPAIAHGTGTAGAWDVAWTLLIAATGGALVASALTRTALDRMKLDRRWTVAALVAGVMLTGILAVVAGGAVLHETVRDFQTNGTEGADPTARLGSIGGARRLMWGAALDAFSAHPLGGTGAGTFELWWNRHPRDTQFLRDSHSMWFDALGEQGLLGALVLALVIVCAGIGLGAARRRLRDPAEAGLCGGLAAMLAAWLVGASVDWMWEYTAVTTIAIVALGIALSSHAGGRLHISLPLRTPLMATAVVVGVLQLGGLVSGAALDQSVRALAAGDTDQAVRSASRVLDAQPWSANGFVRRAVALESSGALDAALADARRAADREPTSFLAWQVIARLQAERGDAGAAVAAFRRMQLLRPYTTAILLAPPLPAWMLSLRRSGERGPQNE